MATFEYIARDQAGATVKGKYSAENDQDVLTYLSSQNYTPLSVQKEKESLLEKRINVTFQRVDPAEVYDFTRQLASMLRSGVPLLGSLTAIKEQTESGRLRDVIATVLRDISAGESLSAALAKHPRVFNAMLVNMVTAGERAGVVDDVLSKVADFMNHDLSIRRDIKRAMRYPTIVVTLIILVSTLAITYVLPKFTVLYTRSDVPLPLLTRLLLSLSQIFQNYWYVILIGIGFIVFAVRAYVKTEKGRFNVHRFSLKMPIFGKLFHKTALARFCHVLNTLDSSGVPIMDALKTSARAVNNDVVYRAVERATQKVAQGQGVAASLENGSLFPRQMLKMIEVGEAAGSMDEMLHEVATLYDAEVDDLLARLTTMIEPILTVTMGVMILILALSMFLPVWSSYEIMTR